MAQRAAVDPDGMPHHAHWCLSALSIAVAIITAPYRRAFRLYTWQPLRELRAAEGNRRRVLALARDFQADKYAELQSVQVAASFCAGATLAVIPWSRNQSASWVADALWFSSLSCSIWAVITSIQTKSILDDLPDRDSLNMSLSESEVQRMCRAILRYRRSPGTGHWIMVFIWQFPSMTMSYAWTTYIAGLTVCICNPFIRREAWSIRHKIAIVYLVVGGIGFITYILSSLFVYLGEKDFQRSAVSTRINTGQLEASMGADTEGQATTEPSGSTDSDPLQRARGRGLFDRDSSEGFNRSGRNRRQLLI